MISWIARLIGRAKPESETKPVNDKLEQIDKRIQEIEKDDQRVNVLERRVERIVTENNLAPAVIRALRLR